MTTISRRDLALGLGAAAVAIPHFGHTTGKAAEPELAGYVAATMLNPDTGEAAPGLTIIDLVDDATATIEMPPVERVFPNPRSSYGIAVTNETLFVVDAEAATATEITPFPGTTFSEPLASLFLSPPEHGSSTSRYAVLPIGFHPAILVDLEQATAVDLRATFASPDAFIRAVPTPDGTHLILGTNDLVGIVSLETMRIERTLSSTSRTRFPELSPNGVRVAFIEMDRETNDYSLRVAKVAGDDAIANVFEDPTGTLSADWLTDEQILLHTVTQDGSTLLTRLDVTTGKTTSAGIVPSQLASYIVADGTRLIATIPYGPEVWWLVDLEDGEVVELTDLEGMAISSSVRPSSQALIFGPMKITGESTAGDRYAVLNTATGSIGTSVDRVEGQVYTWPVLSPDGRSAAIGSSGPAGEELWLLDLVDGALATLPDHLDATFAPDGRSILTRQMGKSDPLAILDLDGRLIRELGAYDGGWWLG